jgi:hypothetical protein
MNPLRSVLLEVLALGGSVVAVAVIATLVLALAQQIGIIRLGQCVVVG